MQYKTHRNARSIVRGVHEQQADLAKCCTGHHLRINARLDGQGQGLVLR